MFHLSIKQVRLQTEMICHRDECRLCDERGIETKTLTDRPDDCSQVIMGLEILLHVCSDVIHLSLRAKDREEQGRRLHGMTVTWWKGKHCPCHVIFCFSSPNASTSIACQQPFYPSLTNHFFFCHWNFITVKDITKPFLLPTPFSGWQLTPKCSLQCLNFRGILLQSLDTKRAFDLTSIRDLLWKTRKSAFNTRLTHFLKPWLIVLSAWDCTEWKVLSSRLEISSDHFTFGKHNEVRQRWIWAEERSWNLHGFSIWYFLLMQWILFHEACQLQTLFQIRGKVLNATYKFWRKSIPYRVLSISLLKNRTCYPNVYMQGLYQSSYWNEGDISFSRCVL